MPAATLREQVILPNIHLITANYPAVQAPLHKNTIAL